MFDEQRICPYTGLRSFTEEESIYFKGRDEHIEEATKLLEKNKFLMLTGASGDGKSSLVYAGIVPNARSGFLKSHYSNWVVADFRPERSPFDNLSECLSAALDIKSSSTVKSELSYGFSALVDLYKNSKYYINKKSEEFNSLSENDQKEALRNGANLLILADQFEEFFTNPENYHNGVTSQESNLVVNLLLETAHLALEYELPIYVVCTMRSDYIGQCAAFRGLPEYIGFSQFFVPRLNRKQLHEVIEEPAVLSGNTISPRLVERLIYDITDGVDQLPILQHALREIWKSANNGEEEMDLIHYAKVGGLPPDDLPDEDIPVFTNWFNQLPGKIRDCYDAHDHHNILNTHANKLLATARDYCKEHYNLALSEKDIRHIIHNTFVCLTKIDHSRAVRNRMTLKEITQITDIPNLTTETVKNVINIYRDSENTLIKPFLSEESGADDKIEDDDVLDITHESLIRNWRLLKEWAHEEYENLNTYHDFKQQLDRWVENDKSSDYLLPIGPLTHFEDWFDTAQPNVYWINRYNEGIDDPELRLQDSQEKLDNAYEFLKSSDRKHLVTRTVMKYGFKRILAVLAVIILVTLSSFYGIETYNQSKSVVYNKVKDNSIPIIKANDVDIELKGRLAIEMIRREPENFEYIFSNLPQKDAFLLALIIAENISNREQRRTNPLLDTLLTNNLMQDLESIDGFQNASEKLYYYNNIISRADYLSAFRKDSIVTKLKEFHIRNLLSFMLSQMYEENDESIDHLELAIALNFILNSGSVSDEEKREILNNISPFETNNPAFSNSFSSGNILRSSLNEYGPDYGGLYMILSDYYAYFGDYEHTLQSIDSLLPENNLYYQNSYFSNLVNATNTSFYLLKRHPELFEKFITDYCSREGINEWDFYGKLLRKGQISPWFSSISVNLGEDRWYYNRNLDKMTYEDLSTIAEIYKNKLLATADSDRKWYELALLHKLLGVYKVDYEFRYNLDVNYSISYPFFDTAFDYYNKVSDSFLDQQVTMELLAIRSRASYRSIFVHPDVISNKRTWDPRAYDFIFNNASFISYLKQKELYESVYKDDYLIETIEEWTVNYLAVKLFQRTDGGRRLYEDDASFTSFLVMDPFFAENLQVPKFLYSNYLFNQDSSTKAVEVMEKVNLNGITGRIESNLIGSAQLFYVVGHVVSDLVEAGHEDIASKIITSVGRPGNKSSLYGFIGYQLALSENDPLAKSYLDSASSLYPEVRSSFQPNRITVLSARILIPEAEQQNQAIEAWKNFPNKWPAERYMTISYGHSQKYFEAYDLIDPLFSNERKGWRYFELLYSSRLSATESSNDWKHYDENSIIYLEPIARIN